MAIHMNETISVKMLQKIPEITGNNLLTFIQS